MKGGAINAISYLINNYIALYVSNPNLMAMLPFGNGTNNVCGVIP